MELNLNSLTVAPRSRLGLFKKVGSWNRKIKGYTCFRRIEDKLDAKNLASTMIVVRMDNPPSSKKVPLQFVAWVVMQDSTMADNVFKDSQLLADRTKQFPNNSLL